MIVVYDGTCGGEGGGGGGVERGVLLQCMNVHTYDTNHHVVPKSMQQNCFDLVRSHANTHIHTHT